MTVSRRLRSASILVAVTSLVAADSTSAQSTPAPDEVTFTKDIAPILQRSCQRCHRPDSVAPMSLLTYEDARPWARAMKQRTGLRTQRGAMPPWFIDRNIGIQEFKGDYSLSEEEIAKLAKWADSGAPRGNPADMPPPLDFADANKWTIGQPDLVVRSPEVIVAAAAPDQWGSLGMVPTGLGEDRYVSAVEVHEVNDVPTRGASSTVGARYVFHHMTYSSVRPNEANEGNTRFLTHEVGRNPDIYAPEAGRLLHANSSLSFHSYHLHSNGRETKAHLEVGFKFHPRGYKPLYREANVSAGEVSTDMDVKPNKANQELHVWSVLTEHIKMVTFEPHMHAAGVRMCLEAIWGNTVQTLNCTGYDHNWVLQYVYDDDAAPLLPKGTILHLVGIMDTTSANPNFPDSRNWGGFGRRSVANMFLNAGYSVALTDEQLEAEMAKRRRLLKGKNDYAIGCPLCQAPPLAPTSQNTSAGN